MAEKKDVWAKNNIEPVSDKNQANILGYDYGAGNNCACLAGMPYNGFVAGHLWYDVGHADDNLYTVYTVGDGVDIVGEEATKREGEKKIAVNFKMPLTEECEKGCRNIPEMPNKEVMRRFFQRALMNIFENNDNQLKGKKRTVVFVGRPSSQIWEETEEAYRQLLMKGLEEKLHTIPDYEDHKVDIIIYSEAMAALAYEYSQGNIKPDEAVLIIDCGSSTFDAVLVKNRQILTEYSRQLGAGQIDEIMTDMLLAQGDQECMTSVAAREKMREEKSRLLSGTAGRPELVIKARKVKEMFYGKNGLESTPQMLCCTFSGNKKYVSQIFDETSMEQVIFHVPVEVQPSYDDDHELRPFLDEHAFTHHGSEFPSFYDATKDFMEGAVRACKNKGVQPDRVILTGGASVMPFIDELVKEYFGLSAFDARQNVARSKNPAFSVGEGLAFMGFVEVAKRESLINYRNKIDQYIDQSTVALIIRNAVKQAYIQEGWNSLIKDLEVWAVSDIYGKTIISGIRGSGSFNRPTQKMAQGIQTTLNNICKDISQMLSEEFKKLFKTQSAFTFHYRLPENKILEIIKKNEKMNKINYSPIDLFGWWSALVTNFNTERTLPERRQFLTKIKEHESQVKEGLGKQFWEKSQWIVEDFQSLLKTEMKEALESYMEDCTPYFVEKIQN